MFKLNKKQLIISSLALVLTLGLFGCAKKPVPLINSNVDQNQNANANTNTATTTAATSTAEIDTSNWKTYRNEEYGFEFKYPGDWNLFVNEDSGNSWTSYKIKPLVLVEIKNVKKDKEISCTLGGPVLPPEGMSIKLLVEKTIDDSFNKIIQNCDSRSETGHCITRIENFNGNKVLIIDDSMSPCDFFPKAYIIKDSYKYSINSIWYSGQEKDSSYQQSLFYKIMETLIIN